jgi:hypothetical protein
MMKLSSSIFVLVAAVGCGGGRNGPTVLPDTPDDPPDAPQVTCRLGTVGAATPSRQVGFFDTTMNPDTADFEIAMDINADATPDFIDILFFNGFGAFNPMPPATPATIQLTGVEAQFQSCGACVLAITDIDMGTGMSPDPDPYLATGGTLMLTSITQQRIAGTLSNLTFTHVTIDDMALSAPHPDGCSATVGSVAFDAVPMMAMMKKDGPIEGIRIKTSSLRRLAD